MLAPSGHDSQDAADQRQRALFRGLTRLFAMVAGVFLIVATLTWLMTGDTPALLMAVVAFMTLAAGSSRLFQAMS